MKKIKKEQRKKYIFRIIFAILLILTCSIIFKFSSQNGNDSQGVSTKVMENIINIFPLNDETKLKTLEICEPILRKIAHFTIYSITGIWTICLLSTYEINEKNKIVISVFSGFLYACSDEFHQSLTPGRGPGFNDVILDTIGVAFGTILVVIITKIKKDRDEKKRALTK